MQTDRPIGIFDSGLGGLTIVKAVHKVLPEEKIIYYGDTAHLPYGDKSPQLIRGYCTRITRFLLEYDVKAIVIACNTASAVARDVVEELAGEIPVFDVIRPAVNAALDHSKRRKIGVIGTKTTIGSNVYKERILRKDPNAEVTQKATPLLVPLIEEGWLHNAVSREVIEAYMSDTGFLNIDALILGCTHYPLVKSDMENYFRQNFSHEVAVIDSSLAVANRIKEDLASKELLSTERKEADEFYASDYSQNFHASAKRFLEKEVDFIKLPV